MPHSSASLPQYIMSCPVTTIMPDVPYFAAGMKHDNELEVQGREQIVAPCSPVTIVGETMSIKDIFNGQLYAVG